MTTTEKSCDQCEQLAQSGFMVFENFLDAQTVSHLIHEVESLQTDAQASRIRRGTVFARRNLLSLRFVQELIARSPVRKIIATLAPNSVAVRAILFDKTGDANWTVP